MILKMFMFFKNCSHHLKIMFMSFINCSWFLKNASWIFRKNVQDFTKNDHDIKNWFIFSKIIMIFKNCSCVSNIGSLFFDFFHDFRIWFKIFVIILIIFKIWFLFSEIFSCQKICLDFEFVQIPNFRNSLIQKDLNKLWKCLKFDNVWIWKKQNCSDFKFVHMKTNQILNFFILLNVQILENLKFSFSVFW
jgi:hypothetical protein